MKTTKEMIQVMQAYEEGLQIEVCFNGYWHHIGDPGWNWTKFDYRVKIIKPSIDWSHVSDDFNWLATDKSGRSFIYPTKPELAVGGFWLVQYVHAGHRGSTTVDSHSSFKPGACDWKDSLVGRHG